MSIKEVINSHIDTIINCYKKPTAEGYTVDMDEICDMDKRKLAALFIEEDHRDLCCITENDAKDEIVIMLINSLTFNNVNSSATLSETLSDKIVKYYEKRIEQRINERLEIFQYWNSSLNDAIERVYDECRI